MSRRSAREAVFKILFQSDITGESPEVVFTQPYFQEALPQEADRDFARELAAGIGGTLAELDETLTPYLKKWHLKRLPVTDRAILRLAIYEILHVREVPAKVSINEALELAKKYGDVKSGPFINGVLDSLLRTVKEEGGE